MFSVMMLHRMFGRRAWACFFRVQVLLCGLALLLVFAGSGLGGELLMPMTHGWRYSTNNLDAVNWRAVGYAETGWSNLSPALLYVETTALPAPKNTPLPERSGGGPMLTYYFRTTFNVADAEAVVSLTFSNLIDDGAIFYLNGVEVQRVGMGSTNIFYTSTAARSVGNASVFDVFSIYGDWLRNLVSGNNVLAVEVHQAAASSSDVVFGSALIGATDLNLTRGPYLQNGSSTALTVCWRTDVPTVGRVRYGTNLAGLNLLTDEVGHTNEHEVRVTGLLPDTKYFYSVGTSGVTLAGSNADHFFVTAPVPGTPKPTRIWVLGDAGVAGRGVPAQTANQAAVRDAYYTFTGARHTDLWLMLGDNAYDTGTDAQYQAAVFDMYPTMLSKSVLWSALGNHETAQDPSLSDNYSYFDIFSLPRNGESGGVASGSEHYYSFDYANIHFICLDSMTAIYRATNSVMYQWLTNDLADVTADWTIAFWHHPAYTKGSHDSENEAELIEMREVFLPVLESAGVDLVLAGHSHVYERSFLLDKHYVGTGGFSVTNQIDAGSGRENGSGAYRKPEGGLIGHQGAVYAVVGSSGQNTSIASLKGTNHPAMYISLNNLGSLVLDVASNRLDAKFIRENGTTNDYFSIVKINYAPVASNLTYVVNADAATNLTLKASDLNRNPLNFVTDTLPGHGLISGFNPANGAFTYTPAHGYTGSGNFTYHANDGLTNSPSVTVTVTVLPPLDRDVNGVPDYWESLYNVPNPGADNDGDGLSNAQEYWANTNPTNAASALRITSVTQNLSGHSTIVWASTGGTRYRVQFRDGTTGAFTDIVRMVALEMDSASVGTASEQSFTDDFSLTGGAPTDGARYYRVQVVR